MMSRAVSVPTCFSAALSIVSPSPPFARKSGTETEYIPAAQDDSQRVEVQLLVSQRTRLLSSSTRTTIAPAGASLGLREAPNFSQSITYRSPDTRIGAFPARSTASR